MCGLQRKRERGRQSSFWGAGVRWGRQSGQSFDRLPTDDRSPLMPVAPLRLHGLGLERLDVVQQLEVA